MTKYYRIMAGKKSIYAKECLEGGFIGCDWDVDYDLSGLLPEDFKSFNKDFIPRYLESNPGKSKIAAGLAGGMLHTIGKGIQQGDVILMPDEQGNFHFGTVTSDYQFVPEALLQHRRQLQWLPVSVHRHDFSDSLRNSLGSLGTVANVSRYAPEIESLINGVVAPTIFSTNSEVEDPSAFALEKHLEDFLVANWDKTDLGKTHHIYSEDGEKIGQQYPSDTGPIDILAVSHDGKELLVIELKRGRASDSVVGQIQRYMGYVQGELAEPGQTVRGVIIALDDDKRIRRALAVAANIEFYRYQIDFKLFKA